jgi:hypothetical protein
MVVVVGLVAQGLKAIEGLDLPNLKELFLHQNAIRKIENLEGSVRIRMMMMMVMMTMMMMMMMR